MKRTTKIVLVWALVLLCGLPGCSKDDSPAQYDMDGIACLVFSDIDTVCEDAALTDAGQRLLSGQEDGLLLSYVVDSAILITEELGAYDHLVMTNPQWVERFGSTGKLKPVSFDTLSEKMQAFLNDQMPILTADGSVLPQNAGLYEYEGGGLLAFPPNVTLGAAEPVEAKNPLVILIDGPAQALDPKSCALPLVSSGNILFLDQGKLEMAFQSSGLERYGEVQALGQTAVD